MQAVTYLRVSGKAQVDGDGFPRQQEAVALYAAAHALELVGEYRDAGVSGTKDLDDREGLSELLARVRTNGVKIVLVERADRLARDLIVGELILAEFRRAGVKVIAVDGDTDLTAADGDPTRTLIRQVLGAVAQFEKAVIVSKLKAARGRRKREVGRCEGRKPFGAYPGEAFVLGKIADMRAFGHTLQGIADRLNAARIPTRGGRPWHLSTVRAIVRRLRTESPREP